MRRFKFFSRNIEHASLPDDYATWMWDFDGVINPNLNYEMMTDHFTGIGEFLGYFPEHSIVILHSIVGVESGIVHTKDNVGTGWGFDVREDLLEITWYQFFEDLEIGMD